VIKTCFFLIRIITMGFSKIWLCLILIMCKHIISGSNEMPIQFEYELATHPEIIIGEFRCAGTAPCCCILQRINSKKFDGKVKFCISAQYISHVELYTADFKPPIQGKVILDMLKTFADTWSTAKTRYSVRVIDGSNVKQLGLLTKGTTYYEMNGFACKTFTLKCKSQYDKITNLEIIWTDIEDCMNEYFFPGTNHDFGGTDVNICLKKMENEFHTFKPQNSNKLKVKEYWEIMQKTMKACDVYDNETAAAHDRVRRVKQYFPDKLSSCIIAQQLYVDGFNVKYLHMIRKHNCSKMKYYGKCKKKNRSLELAVSELHTFLFSNK